MSWDFGFRVGEKVNKVMGLRQEEIDITLYHIAISIVASGTKSGLDFFTISL